MNNWPADFTRNCGFAAKLEWAECQQYDIWPEDGINLVVI